MPFVSQKLYLIFAKTMHVYELFDINASLDFYNTIFVEGVQIARSIRANNSWNE